jgi:hypothetical protein
MRPIALAVACALALPPLPVLAQAAGRARASAAQPAQPTQNGQNDDTAYLNFVNVDIEQAVRAVGQFTGRQFVIDPRVKGTVNIVTERPVTRQQAYEQLLSALRLQAVFRASCPRPMPSCRAAAWSAPSRWHRAATRSSRRCSSCSTNRPPTWCRSCGR